MQFLVVFVIGLFFYYSVSKNKSANLLVPTTVFFILVFMNFFGAVGKFSIAITFLALPFVFFEYSQRGIFKNYIIVFIIGLFLSMASCFYYRSQSIFDSLSVYNSYTLFGVFFYFFIRPFNLSISQMERVLLILFILFLGAYILQYLVYPTNIFIEKEQEYEEDIRIRLTGQGLASLGYFFSLNKILLYGRKRVIYIVILLVSLIVIFLMGFRTMLVGVVAMSAVMVIKVTGFNFRLLGLSILFLLSSVFIMRIPIVSEKIDAMVERQKTDNLSNSDYIRFAQIQYYTQEHFKSDIEYVLGSGLPLREKKNMSSYGKYMDGLVDNGLNWVDWGLWSFSWVIGIIPVLTIIFYSIRAFLIKVDKDFIYLGVWFLYLVIISFTTMEVLRPGNIALEAFCFIIIEQVSKINKNQSIKHKVLPNSGMN